MNIPKIQLLNNSYNITNNGSVPFQGSKTLTADTFSTTNPYQQNSYSSLEDKILASLLPEKFIAKHTNIELFNKALTNKSIMELLKENNIQPQINISNINSIIKSHLIPTKDYALLIMRNSGKNFTQKDYEIMTQAALLHDIGKALIPDKILNKVEKLTAKERTIIELHNELGYKILQLDKINPEVRELIKNHHNYFGKTTNSELSQILTIADRFSALKENRPYKKAMSNEKAFQILYDGAKQGDYNKFYVDVLTKNV